MTHKLLAKYGVLFALGIISVRGPEANAQMTIPVPRSPHSNVHFTRLSEDAVALRSPLQGNDLSPLRNSAFVIHNEDPRSIIGIYAVWTVIDQSGKSSTITLKSDRFLDTLDHSVVPAKGQLILAPNGWLPTTVITPQATSKRPDDGLAARAMADRVKQAKEVTLTIDAIIFQDGEIWGANVAHFDDEIRQRKLAADDINKLSRETLASGGDLKARLKTVMSTPYKKSDFRAEWQHRFAQQLLMQPANAQNVLAYLEALPAPIPFTPRQ